MENILTGIWNAAWTRISSTLVTTVIAIDRFWQCYWCAK